MTASSNNRFLLFCSALTFSAAVLCRGEPVLDSNGNAVGLAGTGLMYRIQRVGAGPHGRLARLPINQCQGYISEAPETSPGHPLSFAAAAAASAPSNSDGTVMQTGLLYTYSFVPPTPSPVRPRICIDLDVWLWPIDSANGNTTLPPLVAGQYARVGRPKSETWFAVASAGGKGVYQMFACPCVGCPLQCPTVVSTVVNGTTVLGVGTEPFTFQFVMA